MIKQQEEITALYCCLSQDGGREGEINSIVNQELTCKGWPLSSNTYDCDSFVVNGKAVIGKGQKGPIIATNSTQKGAVIMRSLFEEVGGTYRQEGDYFIPSLILPNTDEYQIDKHGRMRHSYSKEYHKILYNNYVIDGTLFKHLLEIDQACNERVKTIVSDMAKREGVIGARRAAD